MERVINALCVSLLDIAYIFFGYLQGDGTTSTVLFIGELLKQSERFLADGLHPRILMEGFELAKDEVLRVLESLKVSNKDILKDRELLCSVARTSLRTKLDQKVCWIIRLVWYACVELFYPDLSGDNDNDTNSSPTS